MINNTLILYNSFHIGENGGLENLSHCISARLAHYKCFTLDIPFVKGKPVNKGKITMNAAHFP